ncbi:hypothetical protein GY45DRAFT_848166 [Cubamyces sp. BRFM 1775]|nr:hypothetical protein GY45DRAFT_848166 [Cubamyces sp. BRFM 1775]
MANTELTLQPGVSHQSHSGVISHFQTSSGKGRTPSIRGGRPGEAAVRVDRETAQSQPGINIQPILSDRVAKTLANKLPSSSSPCMPVRLPQACDPRSPPVRRMAPSAVASPYSASRREHLSCARAAADPCTTPVVSNNRGSPGLVLLKRSVASALAGHARRQRVRHRTIRTCLYRTRPLTIATSAQRGGHIAGVNENWPERASPIAMTSQSLTGCNPGCAFRLCLEVRLDVF